VPRSPLGGRDRGSGVAGTVSRDPTVPRSPLGGRDRGSGEAGTVSRGPTVPRSPLGGGDADGWGTIGSVFAVSRTIPAPPDVVWALLVDVESWPRWEPTIGLAWLSDGMTEIHEGSTGKVQPPLGPALPFTVTDLVPGRRWSWRVAGVPATSYEVEAAGTPPGQSRVTFSVPIWAPAYLAVNALALRRLERLAVGGD
jgi:uncharacterized protein YndB with AHSA1/START domain